MSNLNDLPSTSGQGKSASQFLSLADILNAKPAKSGVRTRSADKDQLKIDLQKNLDGITGASSRLNFSRAFNTGAETFNFVDPTAVAAERKNQTEAQGDGARSAQVNSHHHNLQSEKHTRATRRQQQDGKHSKKDDRSFNASLSSFGEDPKVQIEKLINRIENKDAHFDFDEDKHKNGIATQKVPGFNFLQLPKDFPIERGRVNVYRSGVIEVVSRDCPSQVFRFKPTIRGINSVTTDLIITTENQVLFDRMNVYSPETLEEANS